MKVLQFISIILFVLIISSCQKIKFKTDVFTFNSQSLGDKELILKSYEDFLFTFTYQNEPCYLRQVGEDSVYGIWKFDETTGDIFNTEIAYSLAGRILKEKRRHKFSGTVTFKKEENNFTEVFNLVPNK